MELCPVLVKISFISSHSSSFQGHKSGRGPLQQERPGRSVQGWWTNIWRGGGERVGEDIRVGVSEGGSAGGRELLRLPAEVE